MFYLILMCVSIVKIEFARMELYRTQFIPYQQNHILFEDEKQGCNIAIVIRFCRKYL